MRETSVDSLIRKMISTRMRKSSELCADENTMAAYLEGRLSPEETAAFEAHASECASCQEILALSMKLHDQEADVLETAKPATGRKVLFHFSIPIPVLGGIFATIVIIAGLVFLYKPGRNLQQPQSAELHMPAPEAETARRDTAITAPPVNKAKTAAEKPAVEPSAVEKPAVERPVDEPAIERQAQIIDKKQEESESAGLKEAEPPAPAPPAVGGAAIAGRADGEKMAAAGASAEKRAEMPPPPIAALDQVGDMRAMTALNAAPPKDLVLGATTARARASSLESRKIGDKVFYFNLGYWIDRQCTEHKDAPIIEILDVAPEYKSILAKYPGLRDLRPIIVFWEGKNYLLRP